MSSSSSSPGSVNCERESRRRAQKFPFLCVWAVGKYPTDCRKLAVSCHCLIITEFFREQPPVLFTILFSPKGAKKAPPITGDAK